MSILENETAHRTQLFYSVYPTTLSLLGLVQHVQVEGGHGGLGKLLEVSVHLLGGLRSEDLAQHLGEDGELVWVVGYPELAGNNWSVILIRYIHSNGNNWTGNEIAYGILI